jgi:HAD superfamily hydrolase (TIGR01509 family)
LFDKPDQSDYEDKPLIQAVILDVDGTLVDSNDAHAQAWVEAFQQHGYDVPFERARKLIGMGGDNFLPTAIGVEEDSDIGKAIGKTRGQIFKTQYLPELKPFPRVRELVEKMRAAGLTLVVGSSAEREELDTLLRIAGVVDLLEDVTSADDAARSKPHPDIVHASLKKAGSKPGETLMLGDTPYDVEAASRAGVGTVAVRCGGWNDDDLKGALAIYDDPANLLIHFDISPFAVRT